MKRLTTAIAAIALIGTPAFAADMAVKAPAPAPVPAYNWTGFYVGVNGGFGVSARDSSVTATNFEETEAPPTAILFAAPALIGVATTRGAIFDPIGGFGGGQIGYNWQTTPQWVLGIEADIQGGSIKDGATASAPNPLPTDLNDVPPGVVNAFAESKLDWFGTVRGRLGYTFNDNRTMIYATGGFAYGHVNDTLTVTELSEGTLLSGTANNDRTATGWVVGGGIEGYFAPSWSLKIEYQYIDLGSTTLATLALQPNGTPDCCDRPTGAANFNHQYHTVRLGLNYKFGGY